MIKIRKSQDRGTANFGWLNAKHSFSFGRYVDRAHMGFGPLRVINEDRVAPGKGFAEHPHDNMEIVTYVLEGELEHKDSMGNGSIIRPGEIQRMSSGSGVTHSEYNHSNDNEVHLLQIWFLPEAQDVEPGYEQKTYSPEEKQDQLKLVLSRGGRDNTVALNQDVDMYVGLLDGKAVEHTPQAGRKQWVQIARGTVDLNGQTLSQGDGAAIENEDILRFENAKDAEVILFDMADI
jgi:hypothetical protein